MHMAVFRVGTSTVTKQYCFEKNSIGVTMTSPLFTQSSIPLAWSQARSLIVCSHAASLGLR